MKQGCLKGEFKTLAKAVPCKPLKTSPSFWQTCHQIVMDHQEAGCSWMLPCLWRIPVLPPSSSAACTQACLVCHVVNNQCNSSIIIQTLTQGSWMICVTGSPKWEIVYSEVTQASNNLDGFFYRYDRLYRESLYEIKIPEPVSCRNLPCFGKVRSLVVVSRFAGK